MIDTIYLEDAAADHPRSVRILDRYPRARVIECTNYQTVFNRKQQNFRAQKSRPALILALKRSPFVHPVAGEQHLGAPHNYYFSHLLNCPFDCRYCFLQGMFSSANYVLFVNYESFADDIARICQSHDGLVHMFSGYDCDSLALEPLTGFAAYFIERFAAIDNGVLELRTKSTQVRPLLRLTPHERCVLAMSLAPDEVIDAFEHGAPGLDERLDALARVQARGWPIGLRFDPIIGIPDGERIYGSLFARVFGTLGCEGVHSVTLGAMRLPRSFAKRMFKLYPDEPLFACSFSDSDGVLYAEAAEHLFATAVRDLQRYVPARKIFAQHAIEPVSP